MLTLDMVDSGSVKIISLRCGSALRSRLRELGIYEGSTIKIVKNDFCCPLILMVKGSKVALGRGQARKIIVQ